MMTNQPTPDQADDPVMRFLTAGGAVVEVRNRRFTTRYTYQGRPYVYSDGKTREVDGFVWTCLGCGTTGTDSFKYKDGYLPNERREARDDAQAHSAECRALPKPDGA